MTKQNNEIRLRELLLQIYVSGAMRPDDLPPSEWDRLHTIVLDAAEGRPFEELGLPFPTHHSEQAGNFLDSLAAPLADVIAGAMGKQVWAQTGAEGREAFVEAMREALHTASKRLRSANE